MLGIPDILFSNPLGLLALISVIPLIILYLLRPRTIDLDIPSLLFILKREEQRSKLSLLFRRLIRDPLFLVQLLVLILLSLAVASPYIMDEKASGQHTVIIIDNSASMQAGGRLASAKEMAARKLSAVNSVVWAQNVPVLALKEGDSTRAKEVIVLTPQRCVASDIAAAITYAERLAGPGGSIIVFSDFASWAGDDPLVAKGLAEYNGVMVEFVQVGGTGSGNIGIVNGWVDISEGRYNLNLAVKNYNEQDVTVQLDIQSEDERRSGTLDIPAHSTRAYIIPDLSTGRTEVILSNGGALQIDDSAYVFIPSAARGGILLVDIRDHSPTVTALGLLPANVEHTASLPQDLSDYGTVIMGYVDYSPGDKDVLTEFVDTGNTLIVMASEYLVDADIGPLPISITGISNETELTAVAKTPFTGSIPLTDIEVVRHLKGTSPDGVIVLLEASDASPVLSYWRKGKGTVVYLGLNDITGDNAWSGFNIMPEFPLFWKNMIDWTGGTDLDEHNIITGAVVRLPAQQTVTCPDGSTLTTNNLWIDQVGFYQVQAKILAANLYDAKESGVNEISLDVGSITSKYIKRPQIVSVEGSKDITEYLIWVVLGLILAELFIIHRRRELF